MKDKRSLKPGIVAGTSRKPFYSLMLPARKPEAVEHAHDESYLYPTQHWSGLKQYGNFIAGGTRFRLGWPIPSQADLGNPLADALRDVKIFGSFTKREIEAASGKLRHESFSRKIHGKSDKVYVVISKPEADVRVPTTTPLPDVLGVGLLARVRELLGGRLPPPRLLADPKTQIDELLLAAAKALANEDPPTAVSTISAPASDSDPLRAARERGRQFALDEWAKPENLPLREAATYAGRSDRAINEDRLKGRLYALVQPGKQRGLRYPQWQFDAEPNRLSAVLEPFVQNHASCWVVHNFMQRPLEAISDIRPLEWILDSTRPLAPLIAAAVNRFAGDQGAA